MLQTSIQSPQLPKESLASSVQFSRFAVNLFSPKESGKVFVPSVRFLCVCMCEYSVQCVVAVSLSRQRLASSNSISPRNSFPPSPSPSPAESGTNGKVSGEEFKLEK